MYDILEGVEVVELGSFVFVPLAAAVLADWGADVTKVEHPRTGDPYRGLTTAGMTNSIGDLNLSFQYANRGKRSIGVDVATPQGHDLLLELVSRADVFMTNLRPAVRARLGIEVDDLRPARPDLVYVRGSGYGQHGALAETAALDGTAYWARGGVGAALTPPDAEWPLTQRPAFGDVMAAMTLAGGVAGALYRRATRGEGSVVDVGLLNVGMWQMQRDILSAPYDPPSGGGVWDVTRKERNPTTGTYRTADGRFISLAIVNPDPYWVELCGCLDRPDLATDERFTTMAARQQHNAACVAALDETFGAETFEHWRAALSSFSGAWAPVQRPAELHTDEQALANGFFTEVDTSVGPLQVVSSPVTFDDFDGPRTMAGAPEVGQHTEEILLELDHSWDDIVALKDAGVVT